MTPEPWEFALLALAAFRVWKLIGDDVILDSPRDWLLARLVGHGNEKRGIYWGAFLTCPWCAGFWIAIVLFWGGWLVWPAEVVFVSVPLALSAAVGFLGTVFHALAE